MKTGLVSVSFRKLSPEQIISLAAHCGLGSIEWGGDIHVPCGDPETAARIGALTRAAGLEVACYGSYDRLTDADTRPEAVVATAKALGAPLIRVWAGVLGSADASGDARAEIVRNARRMADLAAGEDIDVAFEYHGGTLTDDAESARNLLENCGRSNLGCLWQPPVNMPVDDCLSGLRTVAPYVRNIHVFAWQGVERLPLAAGHEKWSVLLPEIAAIPGKHRLLLEFVRNDAPDQLTEDAATLTDWLKEMSI